MIFAFRMRMYQFLLSAFLAAFAGNAGSGGFVPPRSGIALAVGCTGCHGMAGQGFASIPAINRKSEPEIVRLMLEFRAGGRRATVMGRIAQGYSDEQIAALAKYFSHRREAR